MVRLGDHRKVPLPSAQPAVHRMGCAIDGLRYVAGLEVSSKLLAQPSPVSVAVPCSDLLHRGRAGGVGAVVQPPLQRGQEGRGLHLCLVLPGVPHPHHMVHLERCLCVPTPLLHARGCQEPLLILAYHVITHI